ncbi:26522_t:CDS:2, partial [Racocetra persica]
MDKTKIFAFKYDPDLTPEGMFADFWQAVDGKQNYGNVWRDCRILARMGIIELKKEDKEIRPMTLYERIIFDLSAKRTTSIPVNEGHPTLN